jgi:hypothetical protein
MKFSVTLTLATLTLVAGCIPRVEIPTGVLEREGFDSFATPRSFDGPGTIYRIDNDGKRFLVTTIQLKSSGGEEQISKYTSTRELSLSNVLETIGVKADALPAAVKAELSAKSNVTVDATKASRLRVADEDREAAVAAWAAKAKPAPGSVYYLIRETVGTKSLKYTVGRGWLASLGLDVKALNTAGYKGEAKAAANDGLELDAQFDQPLYVWYKAEKLVLNSALGAGPNQYIIEFTPAAKRLGL